MAVVPGEGTSGCSSMPIEYWISRATDPYLDDETRKSHLLTLCDRVNFELEGAEIALNILSHKVVSPDQDEALYSLQVVDSLVRNCGEKVLVRAGKFRFLNQLVKLITPKYLGNQTSPEVKTLTIRLLFTWQKHIGDIGKFKEVYKSLKDHKVITADPEIDDDSIIIMHTNSNHRRADFETDETIARLKKLVKNENVEAANEYIKQLLKEKEDKEEKDGERVNNLQKANAICDELQQLHIEKTTEAIGFAPAENPEIRMEKIEKLFEQLYTMRPSIQLYVQEAAERNDDCLGEMITINERVNMWVKRSYDKSKAEQTRKGDRGSSEECTDLLGGALPEEETFGTPPSTSSAMLDKETTAKIPKIPPPPHNFSPLESVDVPFIGFHKTITPQLQRRAVKSTVVMDIKSPIAELTDLSKLFDTSPPHTFTNTKPTLNQLTTPSVDKGTSTKFDEIVLSNREPITVIEKMNLRVLLYRTAHEVNPTIETFVVAITNCGTQTLEDVSVTVKSNSQICQLRLEPPEHFTLPGVTLHNGAPPKFLLLHCLQYQESREVDMNVSVCFKLQFERTITSNVVVSLI